MSRKSKNKGYLGQKEVQKMILDHFPEFEEDDCRSNPMGNTGEDLLLSPAMRKVFPYSVEVKRRKGGIGVCRYMEQAEGFKHTPLCFFREDRGKWYVCMEAKEFLRRLS